ncbi:MAG TPA: hypothetical protein VH253_11550 [Phycisphaerae bacterium]|nr:hypothetical protein [Phycisphaerae bacterium]
MRPTAFTLVLVLLAALALGARFVHGGATAATTTNQTLATTGH